MHKNVFAAALLCGAMLVAASAQAAGVSLKPYHQSVGKDCAVCHTEENAVAGNAFVVPDNKACFACHGSYKDLAEKTAKLEESNPHKSHHYGEGIACTSCHSEHGQSKVYCNECHEFKYTIK